MLYRSVGRNDNPNYATDCDTIPSNTKYLKLVIGSVVDYFKPIKGRNYCEMLQSHSLHQWSPDGVDWVIPSYYNNHLGGSASWYPSDGRQFLSFWGDPEDPLYNGGCCHESYNSTGNWNKAFKLYYAQGKIFPFNKQFSLNYIFIISKQLHYWHLYLSL